MHVAAQRSKHTSLSFMPLLLGSRAAWAQLPAPHPNQSPLLPPPESRASNKLLGLPLPMWLIQSHLSMFHGTYPHPKGASISARQCEEQMG